MECFLDTVVGVGGRLLLLHDGGQCFSDLQAVHGECKGTKMQDNEETVGATQECRNCYGRGTDTYYTNGTYGSKCVE
jgi:hypothetical protein